MRLDPRGLERLEGLLDRSREDYALALQTQLDLLFAKLRSIAQADIMSVTAMQTMTQAIARQAPSFGFEPIGRLATSLSSLLAVSKQNPDTAMSLARSHLEAMYDGLEENCASESFIDAIANLERQVGEFGHNQCSKNQSSIA